MQDDQQPSAPEKGVETPAIPPHSIQTGLLLDIVLSLLRPHELEKLQKYIASYLAKYEQQ